MGSVEYAFGDRPKLIEIRRRIRLQETGLKVIASDVALGALVIDRVVRRTLLIEREVFRGLRHRHVEHLYDVGAIDAALPEEPELDEFEPPFHSPFQLCSPMPHEPLLKENTGITTRPI